VVDNRGLAPRQIQSSGRLQFANRINYMQSFRTREALRLDIEGNEGDSFRKLPSMCDMLWEIDPHAHLDLQASPDGRFTRIFIAPGTIRAAFSLLRPLVALCRSIPDLKQSVKLTHYRRMPHEITLSNDTAYSSSTRWQQRDLTLVLGFGTD